MKKEIISDICNSYNISIDNIEDVLTSVIDSSRGEEDIRYNYIINQKYVLKMNTANMITEEFLQGIKKCVDKYKAIGVWAPDILLNQDKTLLYLLEQDGKIFRCYVEECSPFNVAKDKVEEYTLKEELLGHLGKLASKYSDVDLVKNRSMWSIIDLAPLDVDIDEKQENLNILVGVLEKYNYVSEAEKLKSINEISRKHIIEYFDKLPRCVYQGDLNLSNVLIDDKKHFVGIIDFNMYGTEVNINCFLNESMYYLQEEDFANMSANEIYEKMNEIQKRLLSPIFKYYILNDIEESVYMDYKRVIDISFFPNVMLMTYLIENHKNEDKVIQFINLLCN